MSLWRASRSRSLSLPEIPRITGGLALAAGAIGYLIGAGELARETTLALAIVAVSSIGLIFSGLIDRSTRAARVAQRSLDLLGTREFRRELLRARRRESPLVLARLPGSHDRTRAVSTERERLASVRRGLRRIDIAWANHGDIYVVLPDTDAASARSVVERLRHRAPAAFAGQEPILAAFPEDGLTSAALVAIVTGRPPLGPRHLLAADPVRVPGPQSVDAPKVGASSAVPTGGELQLVEPKPGAPDPLRGSGEPA
jgi:hypothetical protein